MSTEEKVIVSSHGYGSAEIFFLGGHPLNDDIKQGIALSGSIDNTLNQYLRPHKLNTHNCYRSVFIKEKLSYSGTSPKQQKEAMAKIDLAYYEAILLDEIKSVNPTVIVPLDDLALGALYPYTRTQKKPPRRKHWITCYRGSVLPLRDDWQIQLPDPIKIIPVLGPQLLYSEPSARSYTQIDFQRVIENRLHREIVRDFGIVWVCRTIKEFDDYLTRVRRKQPTRVTFDLEFNGGLMTAISFCFDSYEAVSVPFDDKGMSAADKALIMMRIATIMNSHLEKNNQNIKEDWKILERFGFNVTNVLSDTMLKGSLLYPELPKGLDFYTSIYTKIPYYKDEGAEFDPKRHGKDGYYIYNGKDSLAAAIIADEMDKELEENLPLKNLYHNEVAPSILIYKDMDQTGILIDNAVKQKKIIKYENLFHSNEWVLKSMIGNQDFNARAWQQVGELLYEELKFPMRKKLLDNGGWSYKTDKNTLDDLLIHHGESSTAGKIGKNILSRIIMLRKLAKVLEYLKTPLFPDGTFRANTNLAGTETGRSSNSKTLDTDFRTAEDPKSTRATKRLGRSLQTVTKHGFAVDEEIFDDFDDSEIANDIREMFVPRRNYFFVEGDGAGAEARVVFVLADDIDGLIAMDTKPKIHAKTAAAIFGIDATTITKDFPKIPRIGIAYYDIGKRVRHAGNYKMGSFRMAQMTHLDLAFCAEALVKFHAHDPKIQSVFHHDVIDKVKHDRCLSTPFGRKRDFFNSWSDELIKEAIAYIPQSTISDLTKFTMWRIADTLDGYYRKYRFLAEMHDGILAEVHKDYIGPYMTTFKKHYERPIDFRNGSLSRDYELIVPTEMAVGPHNWLNMLEIYG